MSTLCRANIFPLQALVVAGLLPLVLLKQVSRQIVSLFLFFILSFLGEPPDGAERPPSSPDGRAHRAHETEGPLPASRQPLRSTTTSTSANVWTTSANVWTTSAPSSCA